MVKRVLAADVLVLLPEQERAGVLRMTCFHRAMAAEAAVHRRSGVS